MSFIKKTQAAFLKRNSGVFYLMNGFASLIFLGATWAAYELQYLTFSQLTISESLIMFTQLVMELPTGAFADLLGKKITVIISHFLRSSSMFVFAFADTFPEFLIFAVLLGLGEAMGSGASEALLFDTLKQAGIEDEFPKYTSRFGLIFQIGLALSAIIGGYMDLAWMRLPALGYAVTSLIAGIISIRFIEPDIDTEKFTLGNYIRQTKNGIKEITKNSYSKKISLFYVLVAGSTWIVAYSFKTILLTDIGFTAPQIGTFQAIARVLGSILLFRILDKTQFITKKRAFYLFPLLIVISMTPIYWLSKWMTLPFVAITMLVSSARWSVLAGYTNEVFSSKNRATAISTLSMAVSLIFVVVMVSSGPIMEYFGGAPIILTLLGGISLVTALPLGIYLAKNL